MACRLFDGVSLCGTLLTSSGLDSETRLIGVVNTSGPQDLVQYVIGVSLPRHNETKYAAKAMKCFRLRAMDWDEQKDRFVFPLEIVEAAIRTRSVIIDEGEEEVFTTKKFHLYWQRDGDVSRRAWTKDSMHNGDMIMGQMHIIIPAVYFYNPNLCSGVSNLLPLEI